MNEPQNPAPDKAMIALDALEMGCRRREFRLYNASADVRTIKTEIEALRERAAEMALVLRWMAAHRPNSDGERILHIAVEYFTRIIQVRGGEGLPEGTDALEELARLAGRAMAKFVPLAEEGDTPASEAEKYGD